MGIQEHPERDEPGGKSAATHSPQPGGEGRKLSDLTCIIYRVSFRVQRYMYVCIYVPHLEFRVPLN